MNKLIFVILAFVFLSPVVQAQSVAERPEIKVGESCTWSFHDTRYAAPISYFTVTIGNVTADRITADWKTTLGTGGVIVYDKDLNAVRSNGTYKVFDFPLSIGKTWSFEYDASEGMKQWHTKVTGKIVGVEKVTVPAGTFDTFKIVLVRDYRGSSPGYAWNGIVTDTWWYAPQVKNYVKRTFVDSGPGVNPSPIIRELQKCTTQ